MTLLHSFSTFARCAVLQATIVLLSVVLPLTAALLPVAQPKDVEAKKPMTKAALFRLASSTKPITATATLILSLPVFDFNFGKVAIEICYDRWFPDPARALSLKGAELIVWLNGRGIEDYILKSVMFQSHVAMISSNQSYGRGTVIGDSALWQPQILARAPDKKGAYISATIDLKQVRKSRESSRNFQQRRPDL